MRDHNPRPARGMRPRYRICGLLAAATLAGWAGAAGAKPVGPPSFEVVHQFKGGADGGYPVTPKLALDSSGNLYGSAAKGGAGGKGTVWKLLPPGGRRTSWSLKVLHAFDGADDSSPSDVLRDASGTLYVAAGSGTIWAIKPGTGALSPVSAPGPGMDIALASSGRIVGVTHDGGIFGHGTLFQATLSLEGWHTQTLHTFTTTDPLGYWPTSVTVGPDGTAYVATLANTILTKPLYGSVPGILTTIPSDYGELYGGVIPDGQGGVYGSTNQDDANNGAVFRWQPSGGFAPIHVFHGGEGALTPPVLASDGALYGVSNSGGNDSRGLVYRLTPAGQYTVIHNFTGGSDGASPWTGLMEGPGGYLYGTATQGGTHGQGVIFRIHHD